MKREYDMKVFKTCSLVFASFLIVIYGCFIALMTFNLKIVFAIVTFLMYFGIFLMLSRAHKNMMKVFKEMQPKWWMTAFKTIFRLFLGSLFLLLVVYLAQIIAIVLETKDDNITNAMRNKYQLA